MPNVAAFLSDNGPCHDPPPMSKMAT